MLINVWHNIFHIVYCVVLYLCRIGNACHFYNKPVETCVIEHAFNDYSTSFYGIKTGYFVS